MTFSLKTMLGADLMSMYSFVFCVLQGCVVGGIVAPYCLEIIRAVFFLVSYC